MKTEPKGKKTEIKAKKAEPKEKKLKKDLKKDLQIRATSGETTAKVCPHSDFLY